MASRDLRTGETINREQAYHDQDNTRFYIQLTLSIAAIIIGIIAAVVLAVSTTVYQQRQLQKNATDRGQQCFICSLLTYKLSSKDTENHPILSKFTKKSDTDGTRMCCARTPEQWSALMQALMWNPEIRDLDLDTFKPGNFTFSDASLHIRLLPSNFQPHLEVPRFLEDDENVTLILNPYHMDRLVEHVQNVELMQTQAVIMHTGLYYIYSSILFKPDSAKPCRDYDRQTWFHNIVLTRDNDRDSGIIFRSIHTCCDDCIRHQDTSFTGGTLFLQQYDKLHVEVSGYSLTSFRKEGSFFGMMMLNNGSFRGN